MTRPRRIAAAALFGCLTLGFPQHTAAVTAPAAAALCTASNFPYHAAVLVEHSDGSVRTACVGFATTDIGGLDLLRSSGIEFQTSSSYSGSGLGDAICQVDNEPTTYPATCWSGSQYWELLSATAGSGWMSSSRGISSMTIDSGGALGLHYGSENTPPSPWSICSAVTDTPSGTATAAATPALAATTPPHAAGHISTSPTAAAPAVTSATAMASATSRTAPTAAVLAASTSATAGSGRAPASGVSMTTLLGWGVVGGLVGLLGLQLTRRRHR